MLASERSSPPNQIGRRRIDEYRHAIMNGAGEGVGRSHDDRARVHTGEATVSARALEVDGTSLAVFFHHDGIRPQRIDRRSRPASCGTSTSIIVVGAIL